MIIKLGRNRAEIYDDIHDAPMDRYMMYNLYAMLDAGIGSDIQAVDNHYFALITQLTNNKIKEAKDQLVNYRQNLHFIVENISPKMMSFACIVKTWNGTPVKISTQKQVELWSKRIAPDITHKRLNTIINNFKKKLKSRLKLSSQR